MKKFFFTMFACTGMLISVAQVKMPAPSPTQTIRQDFGLGAVEITYSRPGAKGRKIFGGLEAYGSVWRTGANAATKIRFTEPVELGGKKIDSGAYALYTIPGVDQWEVILNKGIDNWGTDGYKESEDVVRFKVDPIKLKKAVETFTIQFDNVKPETCDITLTWDKTSIAIPVKTTVREKIMTQITAAMQTDKKPYWAAAQFYNEYEKNQVKALEYMNHAVEENPKAYYMFLYKAKIQHEMGDDAGAMITSKQSELLAAEAKSDAYVKMNQDLQKKLKK